MEKTVEKVREDEDKEFSSMTDIERMVEFERELREQTHEPHDGENTQSSLTRVPLVSIDEDYQYARVVAVYREESDIVFILQGNEDEFTVTLPYPEEQEFSGGDSRFHDVCRYCDISPKTVTEIQGESVPVWRGRSGWEFAVPETQTLPARLIAKLLFFTKRYLSTKQIAQLVLLTAFVGLSVIFLSTVEQLFTSGVEASSLILALLCGGTWAVLATFCMEFVVPDVMSKVAALLSKYVWPY